MHRYKILIEYDGTNLKGWQKQNNGPSIQGLLEEALFKFSGVVTEIYASGRTDAGVHAMEQVAHFDLPKIYDEYTVLMAMNYYLYEYPISILKVEKISEEFHARFSAVKRSYVYKIINRNSPLALMREKAWLVRSKLDISKMQEAANYLIGRYDFTSFRTVNCQAKSPIITMNKIDVTKKGEEIFIDLEARSFLHHMVRNIVGTLKEVGEGRREAGEIKDILEARNRCEAGATAPACGLYLKKIYYE